MTDLWADHVRLYSQREATRLLTSEQRHADWEHGCGWCDKTFAAHFATVNYAAADRTLGRVFDLSPLTLQSLIHAAELAMTAAAALAPDSERLPA